MGTFETCSRTPVFLVAWEGQSWTVYEGTPNCDVNFAGHMDNNMKLNGMNLLLDTLG